MTTRSMISDRPLCELTPAEKAYVRGILWAAWHDGEFHTVLGRPGSMSNVCVSHIREAARVFHGGQLTVSSFLTDDECESVSIIK